MKSDIQFQSTAVLALQEAAEAHLIRHFEDSNLCAIHCKRVTLFVKDCVVSSKLRGEKPHLTRRDGHGDYLTECQFRR